MNGLIFLIMLLILFGFIYSYHHVNNNTINVFLGFFLIFLIFYYFLFAWTEILNVNPNTKYKSLKDKVLWINTDLINENDINHKQWCDNLLLNETPNQLGLYADNKYVSVNTLQSKLNKFDRLFSHKPNRLHIINNNRQIESYAKKNKIKINNNFIKRFTR